MGAYVVLLSFEMVYLCRKFLCRNLFTDVTVLFMDHVDHSCTYFKKILDLTSVSTLASGIL